MVGEGVEMRMGATRFFATAVGAGTMCCGLIRRSFGFGWSEVSDSVALCLAGEPPLLTTINVGVIRRDSFLSLPTVVPGAVLEEEVVLATLINVGLIRRFTCGAVVVAADG